MRSLTGGGLRTFCCSCQRQSDQSNFTLPWHEFIGHLAQADANTGRLCDMPSAWKKNMNGKQKYDPECTAYEDKHHRFQSK